jgi:hypothetical protein
VRRAAVAYGRFTYGRSRKGGISASGSVDREGQHLIKTDPGPPLETLAPGGELYDSSLKKIVLIGHKKFDTYTTTSSLQGQVTANTTVDWTITLKRVVTPRRHRHR